MPITPARRTVPIALACAAAALLAACGSSPLEPRPSAGRAPAASSAAVQDSASVQTPASTNSGPTIPWYRTH